MRISSSNHAYLRLSGDHPLFINKFCCFEKTHVRRRLFTRFIVVASYYILYDDDVPYLAAVVFHEKFFFSPKQRPNKNNGKCKIMTF